MIQFKLYLIEKYYFRVMFKAILSLFTIKSHKLVRDRILNAFPRAMKNEVEAVLDIIPLNENDIARADGQTHKVEELIHSSIQPINLENESLIIPRRVYFNEPDSEREKKLTDRQRTILNCIYLCHYDGYVRQRRLEQLPDEFEYFVVPYTMQLLGGYVIEIIEVLNKHLTEKNLANYKKFAAENPKYWLQTQSRVISYWDEYYRKKFPKITDYIGMEIVKRINRT